MEVTQGTKSLACNLAVQKAGTCWPLILVQWNAVKSLKLPHLRESGRNISQWTALLGTLRTPLLQGKWVGGWWERILHGLSSLTGPSSPPLIQESWDDHPVLALRQGCSAGSWEGKFRNAALSITDTSSCSRETPCLRGLISILMSCSEAQLGLPTPAGHSHSFTWNYHRTRVLHPPTRSHPPSLDLHRLSEAAEVQSAV